MSVYRDLAEELKQLRKEVKPFIGDFGNLLKPLPSFTQKELDVKIKRIKEIDSILKKADKQIGRFTTPNGNYVSTYNWKIYLDTLKNALL